MFIEGHQVTKPLQLKTHSVVVGSGAGGGVAAYHLAAAGVDTIVLEEGGHFKAKDFNQREEDMYPALYRAGGQQWTTDGMVNVLQGSVLGGGTVINAADVTPIEPEVLWHWQKHFGITDITERSLESSYQRIRKQLEVQSPPDYLINRNNSVILETANKLGYKAGVFDTNRKNCIGSGYCMQGCAYDAKRGTHLNYLPQASELGADIYTDIRVDRLERLGTGRYKVHASVLERGSRAYRLPVEIEAERIVLAAGTVHTPAILKRSGFDKGLPQLGKNVSLQPQLLMGAQFDDSDPMTSWRGIPQSSYLSEFDNNHVDHGLGGFRIEGIGGVLGNLVGGVPGIGDAHKQLMKAYPHTQYSLLLVPDRPSGEMAWEWRDDGTVAPKINYTLTEEWQGRLKDGMRTMGEFFFEAGAKQVFFSNNVFDPITSPDELRKVESFPIRPGLSAFFSAHVQGSCRVGLSAETSVVNQDLQLHNLDNIYVVDGSVMPTTASTHTMLPIMAMSDRAMHRMLDLG